MTVGDEPISSAEQPQGSGAAFPPEPVRYLAVGRILRPWGVHGWVKIEVWTDFPERFTRPDNFLLGQERRPVRLTAGRPVKDGMLIKLAGYDTPEAAGALREQILFIPVEAAMPLPEGEFYRYQLIGLQVWSDAGERLGRVADVWETGSNDVYVVRGDAGQEILLPATPEVILKIDIQQQRMDVHLIEGLLP